jgi:hypothetical protein
MLAGAPTGVLEGLVVLKPLISASPWPDSPTLLSKNRRDPTLKSMIVWLTWSAASGANGCHLYHNNEKIAELGLETTSYTEVVARCVDLNYRLEAFD